MPYLPNSLRITGVRALLLAVAALLMALAPMARAENLPQITVAVGEGQLVRLPAPAENIMVSDPQIADVQVSGPTAFVVFGVKTGRTTLYALDRNGRNVAAYDVRVQHNLAVLNQLLASRFPGQRIVLTSAPNSLMVEGSVASPRDAEAILATLRAALPQNDQIIDRLTIDAPTQVNIRVHVAEVSRSVDQRLGINWQALLNAGDFVFGLATGRDFLVSGGSGSFGSGNTILLPTDAAGSYLGSFKNSKVSIDALIDALDQQGLARTLAQPNLTAVSGQKASFLAGGEFPIPVAQKEGEITIEFKQFGVKLDFVPTVLAPDRISLTVRPEVSDLSDNGAIISNGLTIPALTVRRVETTVELGSGQSLVLGGLLQQGTRDAVTKLPGLGNLPVLGSLFTSTSYQRNETELVVIVTPYIVRPTAPEELQTTLGRYAPERPLESLLLGRAGAQGAAPGATPRLNGPVGFIF